MTEAEWRPACGSCGSTAISVTTMRCGDCGAEWDGSEAGEPVREGDLTGALQVLTGALPGVSLAVVCQALGETDDEFSARVLASFEDPRKGTLEP